jgi:exodeoxyribonuclease VII small subunit
MPKSENTTEETVTFSSSFQALNTILEQFKQKTPGLEESLELFESGVQHIKICQDKLSKAKGRVEELVKTLQEGGQIVTKPFEEME